jgi:DNA-binding PadR family transcriptional regulator
VSLRFAALGLLAQHPGSGYDLLKRFERSMANVWPATQSQLYGELNKLAAAGLIEVSDIGARGRKEYRVTDAGRAELVDWLTEPDDDPPLRSAPLLRVFLLAEIPVESARQHLTRMAERADDYMKRYAAIRDSVPWGSDSDNGPYARAALEYGLRTAAMEGEWARWAIDQIDERAEGNSD